MDDCAPDSVITSQKQDYYVCDACFDADCKNGRQEDLGIRLYSNPCVHYDEKIALQKFALQRYILPRE